MPILPTASELAREASGGSPVALLAIIVAGVVLWLYWQERKRVAKLVDDIMAANVALGDAIKGWEHAIHALRDSIERKGD